MYCAHFLRHYLGFSSENNRQSANYVNKNNGNYSAGIII
jgi:hypothetical protein